jgi:hypothetical protein
MKKHNVHRVRRTKAASSARPIPWGSVILTLVCACALAAGFFYAARQHFSTIDLGLKNSKLRKQIEDLESERRRLVLAKEVSMSPVDIAGVRKEVAPKAVAATAPREQEVARIEVKKPVSPTPETVQISLRESKKPVTNERKPVQTDKAPRSKPGPAADKASSPNERPRVVESERRIAAITTRSF